MWWSAQLFALLSADPSRDLLDFDTFLNRTHPADRSHLQETFTNMRKGIKPRRSEIRTNPEQGPIKVLASYFEVQEDEQGTSIKIFATFQDITHLRQAEDALQKVEERFQQTLENMFEGYALIGFDWKYLSLNQTAAGYDHKMRDEVLCHTMLELHPGLEQTPIFACFRKCMQERSPQDIESSFTFPDGKTRWYALRVQPATEGIFVLCIDITERKQVETEFRQNNEQLQELVKVRTDELETANSQLQAEINERKQVEKALCESEQQLRSLYSSMTEGVALHRIVYDLVGKPSDYQILEVNPAFEKITGISRQEAVGAFASKLYKAGEPPYLDLYAQVAETNVPTRFETSFAPMGKHFEISVFSPEKGRFATVFLDISDRKRAEEAIQTNLQRLYLVLSNLTSSLLLVTNENRIEFANQTFCDYFWLRAAPVDLVGLTAAQVIAMIKDVYQKPEKAISRIKEIVERGQPVIGEEVPMRGGRLCLRDYVPIVINGKIYGRLWQHLDITERTRIEQDLRDSEERYRNIIKYAPAAIYEIDINGNRFISVNDIACEWSGYTNQELLSLSPKDILDEDSLARFRKRIFQKLGGEQVEDTVEYNIKTKGGRWLTMAINTSMFRYKNGMFDSVLAVAHNITERKEIERALEENEKRLSAILEQLPVGVGVIDGNGIPILTNSIMQKYMSTMIPSRNLEQQQRWQSYDNEGRPVPPEQWPGARALRGESVDPGMEFTYIDDEGRENWTQVSATPFRSVGGAIQGGIAIIQDISERKRLEERLRQINSELEARIREHPPI